MKEHYFIGTHQEFRYFINKWKFNSNEWVLIDSYDKVVGRKYIKGYVHFGDTAYQIKDISKIEDYILISLEEVNKNI